MYIADPIGDLLARLKNALERGKKTVDVPHTKELEAILEIVKNHGFVDSYEVQSAEEAAKVQGNILVTLKYIEKGKPAIVGAKRMSKPGVRMYRGYKDIKEVRNGVGVGIYSTSKGYMDDKQARTARIGGEYICEIW